MALSRYKLGELIEFCHADLFVATLLTKKYDFEGMF